MRGGHFRYHLDKVETKIIPGQKKYVAQVSSIEIHSVGGPLDTLHFHCESLRISRIKI